MKRRIVLHEVLLALLFLLPLGCTNAIAAVVTVENSYTNDVVLNIENDLDINTLHIQIDPFPETIINHLDPSKIFAFNPVNNQLILYSIIPNDPIPTGQVLTLQYPSMTENQVITISPPTGKIAAANSLAEEVVFTGGTSAITLVFSAAEVAVTAQAAVGLLVDGHDLDDDGVVDTLDVQEVINRI